MHTPWTYYAGILCVQIMTAEFEEGEEVAVVQQPPVVEAPELPEIKLFGKWSLDDVQLNDMSLQVGSQSTLNSFIKIPV